MEPDSGEALGATRFPHEPLADPSAVGVDPRRLDRAVALFRAQQRAGRFPGGQLVVRRWGHLLANAAAGLSRGYRPSEGEPPRAATARTRFPSFSAGKPLVALCIAHLEERGRLDVRAPIAEVFPEFGWGGKESITTLDVLTHRGGLLMPDFVRAWPAWTDWDRVVDAMVRVRPSLPRGVLAYHPFEFGWVLSEVVRRVSGKTVPEYLAAELTGPMGLGGLRFGATARERSAIARAYWIGRRATFIAGVEIAGRFEEVNNSAAFHGAFVPGAGLVTDAAHLGAFYEFLLAGGVTHAGRSLLSPHTVRRYTERHVFGWDRSNGFPLAVGRGFLLGTGLMPSAYGWWGTDGCFGHPGAFSTVAFGDHRTGLAIAVITNGNHSHRDVMQRFIPLTSALRAAVVR